MWKAISESVPHKNLPGNLIYNKTRASSGGGTGLTAGGWTGVPRSWISPLQSPRRLSSCSSFRTHSGNICGKETEQEGQYRWKNANHWLCKQSSNNLGGKPGCYSVGNVAGRKLIANVCTAKGSMHANIFIDYQQTWKEEQRKKFLWWTQMDGRSCMSAWKTVPTSFEMYM